MRCAGAASCTLRPRKSSTLTTSLWAVVVNAKDNVSTLRMSFTLAPYNHRLIAMRMITDDHLDLENIPE